MPVISINITQRQLDALAQIEAEIETARKSDLASRFGLRSALIRAAIDEYIARRKEATAHDHR